MKELRLRAWAKVNLTLSVRGVRPDGYHLLHSYAASISLGDDVTLQTGEPSRLTVTVDGPDGVPAGSDNLAWKAADALRRLHPGQDRGANVFIQKAIPAAAGMGGASANAAAVLHGLNRLWELGLADDELAAIGLSLGADVPFCLRGGLALMEGVGERLTPLSIPSPLFLVVVTPEARLITADVFRRFDELQGWVPSPEAASTREPVGARVKAGSEEQVGLQERAFEAGVSVVSPETFLDAWRQGPQRLAPLLHNDLEEAALSLCPAVVEAKGALLKAGVVAAVMSGAGPTVIGLCRGEQDAADVAERLGRAGWDARAVGLRPRGVEEV